MVLINNAGVMGGDFRRTNEGFEWRFGVNFMGPFLLSRLLANNLADGRNPRLVQLSSGAHRFARVQFEDQQLRYGTLTTATSLTNGARPRARSLPVGFQTHYARLGTTLSQWRPVSSRPTFLSAMHSATLDRLLIDCAPLVRTADQAAATILYAATAPELAGNGGLYIEDGAPAKTRPTRGIGWGDDARVDPVAADRLWQLAERLVRQPHVAHWPPIADGFSADRCTIPHRQGLQ